MIKIKSVVKFFTIFITLHTLSFSLFALELKAGVTFDTYEKAEDSIGNFGANAGIKEYLTNNLSIQATLKNKKTNDYVAYCGAGYEGNIFNFLTGFLFDIRDGKFRPGLLLNGDIKLFNFITLGANTNFISSTKNIFENYITDLETYLTFHCKNQDISLIFDYAHTKQNPTNSQDKDLSLGGRLDVLALDERSPFKIGLFFGVDTLKNQSEEEISSLDLNVGGRLIFDLEKFGFEVFGESRVFTLTEESQTIPFAVGLTTRFNL